MDFEEFQRIFGKAVSEAQFADKWAMIQHLILAIGDDPKRQGLEETPGRVLASHRELFSGYGKDPKDVFKSFDADGYDEMVAFHNIEFYSTCEHHMLPFFGVAHIAYKPDKQVVGLSKLGRLLEIFTRRLQIQERITVQVTKAMDEHLNPLGSACVLQARHFCCTARGIGKQSSIMTTSSMTGCFRTDPAIRSEFLNLVLKGS